MSDGDALETPSPSRGEGRGEGAGLTTPAASPLIRPLRSHLLPVGEKVFDMLGEG
jgi:hypothetical protein